jgi:hypothetical protein
VSKQDQIQFSPKAMQDMVHPVVVESAERSRYPLVVSISTYGRNGAHLDARSFYQGEDGKYAQTQKGIRVPVAEADKLLEALVQVLNAQHGRPVYRIERES